ncbi:hypothetical protein [Streptomyces albiflavescens]|nr:hypothetical protein [Streptomyces albiflavescens]
MPEIAVLRSRQYQPLAQLVSVTKPAEFGGASSLWPKVQPE